MKVRMNNPERGVALFFSIFALVLLMAIGAAMIFMASTETSINSNYRQEQTAYFAAKAGIEEARSRMMASDPNSINTAGNPLFTSALIAAPTTASPMINYIVNPGSGAAIQPWNSGDPYTDDELCHDGYTTLFPTPPAPNLRCPAANLANTAYASYTSALPFNGTSAALPYKWARIAPKLNSSVSYLVGTGKAATVSNYTVNSNSTSNGTPINGTTVICWDGQEELALTKTNCSQMLTVAGAPMTNVYLITALGVSPNGARKVIQSEAALTPTPPFPYGLFATSTACPAMTFNGSNASTDSYTTANGGTYAGTKASSGGDIGSNGGVDIGNGKIGGLVGVLAPPPAGSGPCATPFTAGPNGTDIGPNCPGPQCVPNSATFLPAPYSFPVPPAPNPLPPNTAYTPPSCGGKKGGLCMVPGTYGNISLSGNSSASALTLAPGTYNINSLSMGGNASITVIPPGAVTLNMGGTGQATVLSIDGNGITDDPIANDFTINYAGTGAITITGNGSSTAILNAPKATLTQKGNGNWYGSILASTVSLGGNAFFHFDRNAALSPNNNGYYTMISYREVPY